MASPPKPTKTVTKQVAAKPPPSKPSANLQKPAQAKVGVLAAPPARPVPSAAASSRGSSSGSSKGPTVNAATGFVTKPAAKGTPARRTAAQTKSLVGRSDIVSSAKGDSRSAAYFASTMPTTQPRATAAPRSSGGSNPIADAAAAVGRAFGGPASNGYLSDSTVKKLTSGESNVFKKMRGG